MIRILTLLFFTASIYAIDNQIESYQKLTLAQYQQLDKAKAMQVETKQKIDGYVGEYQKLWGIEDKIQFKCSNGIKSLPHYSTVTPNTDLGKLITRNCEFLEKLKGAETAVSNNITKIQQMLKEYDVAIVKDSNENVFFADTSSAPFKVTYNKSVDTSSAVQNRLDKVLKNNKEKQEKSKDDSSKTKETETIEMVLTDTYNSKEELESATNEVKKVTESELDKKLSKDDKSALADISKTDAIEDAKKSQEAGCSAYDQTCHSLPKWPSQDTVISGVTCNEMRKKDGMTWKSRYNYKCSGEKVILLSDHYQYKKLGVCSLGSERSNNLITIKDGAPVFWRTKSGGFQVYACLNGKSRITVGSVLFKGVKCSAHGKKPGDSWETFGPSIEAECSGMCYVDKKEKVKRATKWNWHCDTYGHIIPGSKSYVGKSSQIKRVQIDGLVRYQRIKPDKYTLKACKVATRQIQ